MSQINIVFRQKIQWITIIQTKCSILQKSYSEFSKVELDEGPDVASGTVVGTLLSKHQCVGEEERMKIDKYRFSCMQLQKLFITVA